jgi:AraC-like DNA-binding protein
MTQDYAYYAVIKMIDRQLIIGPVYLEKKQRIYTYEAFCEEVLLLFYVCTGKKLNFQQLNTENYMTQELTENIKKEEQKHYFKYQENSQKHNPYSREVREMESIRRGNEEMLLKSLDEFFEGEYAVLSKKPLQAAKNLAIVGLAISARAAIEGGIPYEESFLMNDNYILMVDEAENIGEIEALVRRAKIEYTRKVKKIQSLKKGNATVEACKNAVFRKLHGKIVISDLADELGVSKEYLSTIFKETTGICLSDYIMKNKVTLARNMLIYSDYSISSIATYLGFSSQSHLGNVFKKYEHMTPKEYRNTYGNNFF